MVNADAQVNQHITDLGPVGQAEQIALNLISTVVSCSLPESNSNSTQLTQFTHLTHLSAHVIEPSQPSNLNDTHLHPDPTTAQNHDPTAAHAAPCGDVHASREHCVLGTS